MTEALLGVRPLECGGVSDLPVLPEFEAFRRELDAGMWAAVPTEGLAGRREAELVRSFDEVPRDAERVIFFPRAAGGAAPAGR